MRLKTHPGPCREPGHVLHNGNGRQGAPADRDVQRGTFEAGSAGLLPALLTNTTAPVARRGSIAFVSTLPTTTATRLCPVSIAGQTRDRLLRLAHYTAGGANAPQENTQQC